jgi:hypothetical protein
LRSRRAGSILSANEAKFRERSQRVKIQQKQSCKMNGAPIGGKNLRRSTIPAHRPLDEDRIHAACGS